MLGRAAIVGLIVVLPLSLGVLYYLNHHVGLVSSRNPDLLTQLDWIEIGAHVDADNLLLLLFLMLTDVSVVVQACPSLLGKGTELHHFVAVALLAVTLHRVDESAVQLLVDFVCLKIDEDALDGFGHTRLDDSIDSRLAARLGA